MATPYFVGAEETIKTPTLYAEIESIDGANKAEFKCEVGRFDGRVHGVFNSWESVERRPKSKPGR
jgi:hypothetical protein